MCDIVYELKKAKAEVESGVVPDQLPDLLDSAIELIESLKEMRHFRVRFEDEELSVKEVIKLYKQYRYGKE